MPIYKPDVTATIYAQVLFGDGTPANAAVVTLDIYRDDGTVFLGPVIMPYIAGSDGLYSYAFTTPIDEEIMVANMASVGPVAFGTEDVIILDIGAMKPIFEV